MIGMGFAEIVLLPILLGMGGSLPLSIPPLPEDAALVSAAPEECLFYFQCNGLAESDGKSTNHVERLMAEPEVRHFVGTVWAKVNEACRRDAFGMGESDARLFADNVLPLIETAFTRPSSVFVSEVTIAPGGTMPDIRGGAIVFTGSRTEQTKKILARLEGMFAEELGASTDVTIEGVEMSELPLPPDAPKVVWGFSGEYLLIGVGEGSAERMLKAMKAKSGAPAWLAGLHKRLPVERPATVTFINVKGILDLVNPFIGGEFGPMLDAVGVANLRSISAVTGLDDLDIISRAHIETEGELKGVLALASDKPLTAADLKDVPADATWATVVRFDAAHAYETVMGIVGGVFPPAVDEVAGGMRELEAELGFHPKTDLIDSLGDTWSIYNSPGDGGLLVTGFCAVLHVKNKEGMKKVQDGMIRLVNANSGGEVVTNFEFSGHTVHVVNIPEDAVPLAPSWCLMDDKLVFGLVPQTVKAYLSRGDDAKSLADNKEVALLLEDPAIAIGYTDTRAVAELLYPILQFTAPVICQAMREEGFEITPDVLPSATAIYPHLLPGAYAIRRKDDGIHFESHQSAPAMGGAVAVLPMMFFMLARSEAVYHEGAVGGPVGGGPIRVKAVNNLRQIGIAMHNHADTNLKLPAHAICDEDGKPLLSWRVAILPYIEQQALYEQFHLDEPWDSEHNKALIAKMPETYANPTLFGGAAKHDHGDEGHDHDHDDVSAFKTRYVVPLGDGTMFPNGEDERERGVSFGAVTDGLSNTIMALEAPKDKAVIWTKPDDWELDLDEPSAGLFEDGSLSVVMGDGSVRTLRKGVADEILKALFTRAGGEVVGGEALGGDAPTDARIERAVPAPATRPALPPRSIPAPKPR